MTSFVATTLILILSSAAAAYEEPAYEVVKEFDAFELRQYAPYLVAEVEVEGGFDDVGSEAFRILVDFINGENRPQSKIDMTAPVTQEPAGEKIAMTAPVSQSPSEAEGTYRIRFVMPASYTMETLPEPNDPRIEIREVPVRQVAARRYTGFWSERRFRAQETALLSALDAADYRPLGASIYARYNSPFALWFLRRNEVLVEVEAR